MKQVMGKPVRLTRQTGRQVLRRGKDDSGCYTVRRHHEKLRRI